MAVVERTNANLAQADRPPQRAGLAAHALHRTASRAVRSVA